MMDLKNHTERLYSSLKKLKKLYINIQLNYRTHSYNLLRKYSLGIAFGNHEKKYNKYK